MYYNILNNTFTFFLNVLFIEFYLKLKSHKLGFSNRIAQTVNAT